MMLQDMENACLLELQQPGAVAFGTAPNWSVLTNPQIAQATVDFYINQGYIRLATDLSLYKLNIIRACLPTQVNQGSYAIPPAPVPIATTATAAIGGGLQTVTPASMANIAPGVPIAVDTGANLEVVKVLYPTTATTFTAVFAKPHAINTTLTTVTYPKIAAVREIYYTPTGLTYTQRYGPGDIISYDEFNLYTEQGYLAKTAYGTQPAKVSISNDRANLLLFPGTIVTTDIIGVQYTAIPTIGATLCPTLVNPTDIPNFPDDCHEAIMQYALSKLWLRERQVAMADRALKQYTDIELPRIKENYRQVSFGDTQQMRPREGDIPFGLGALGGGW